MQEINLKLAVEDVNMILEGVGTLPFARVYVLVGKIQEQASQQLRATHATADQAGARTDSGAAS
jgi:hypothetical protein